MIPLPLLLITLGTLLGLGLWAGIGAGRGAPLAEQTKMVTLLGRRALLYGPPGARSNRLVVYFHGHGVTVSTASMAAVMNGVARAKRPVALVVPQLGPNSEPGNLSTELAAFAVAAERALGFGNATPTLDVVAHSGGYNAAADAARQAPLHGIALLDALYGRELDFERFARAPTTARFIDVYGPGTAPRSMALQKALAGRVPAGRVVFVESGVEHTQVPAVWMSRVVDALAEGAL